jgi:UDP-N-acetylmuramoylalanine--D-glutamate ligase
MLELANKQVLVIGLGRPGQAACELLRRSGARVTGVDQANTQDLLNGADKLRPLGIEVTLGVSAPPERDFNLAVLSSALPGSAPLVEAVRRNKVPLISELELGFEQSRCLSIAIAGTNGKGTTAELVERMLTSNHRKAALSGDRARPVCSVIEQTNDLDYLILQTDALQLEITDSLRPLVAVLTSLAPDHLDHFGNADNYVRAHARLFTKQQALDWAIVQSEALARLQELNLPVPAKTLTFSADDPNADLHLCRGQIVSRIPNWPGGLLDMAHCQLRGPHNAENLMAALAVGHVLRLPLGAIVDSVKTYSAGPHCFELVAEINGVQFINDSGGIDTDALGKALLAESLLEAVAEAARNATSGDVVLLSPACSSWDQSRNQQHCGEVFCQAVKSISGGVPDGTPNIHGRTAATQQ